MYVTFNDLPDPQRLFAEIKKKSIFGGKTYLAYDVKNGFYVKRLNWIQVILRRFFATIVIHICIML